MLYVGAMRSQHMSIVIIQHRHMPYAAAAAAADYVIFAFTLDVAAAAACLLRFRCLSLRHGAVMLMPAIATYCVSADAVIRR